MFYGQADCKRLSPLHHHLHRLHLHHLLECATRAAMRTAMNVDCVIKCAQNTMAVTATQMKDSPAILELSNSQFFFITL